MKKLLIIFLYIVGGIISYAIFLDIFKLGDVGLAVIRYESTGYSRGEPETWPVTIDVFCSLFSILFSFDFILLLIFGYIIYLISSVLLNFPKKKNQSSTLKDEVNTKQTLAQNTVTIKESKKVENRLIKCSKCGKEYSNLLSICKYCKEKRPIEKTNEIKAKANKSQEIENTDEKTEDKKSEYNSIVDDLTKLGELKEKGLLTEEEFNEQKKKLLKQ